jgi:anti-sigma factor RsiW
MKECNEVELTISSFADGEADPEEQLNMFRHLAICPECRTFFEAVLTMKKHIAQESRYHAPFELSHHVLHNPGVAKPRRSINHQFYRLSRSRVCLPAPLVGGIVIILAVGMFLISQTRAPQQPDRISNIVLSEHGMSLRVIRVHQE